MTWLGEHSSSVMKVARAYTLTNEECQDLAQEILLQAWRSLSKFEGKSSAATWFYRVSLHSAMNWHRKDRPRRASQQPLLKAQALTAEGTESAEQIQQRETVEELYQAIARLPKTDAALVLLYLDELSYREMAEVLGISQSNASLAVILHEQGVVNLDQPVVTHLPEDVSISTTPEVGATITLRQLASHTSDLPRGVPGRVQSAEGWYDLEPQRLYDHLANVKLNSDPGTDEEYSNFGFGLLGHALERAADKSLDRLLREMICDPLKLERTAIQVDDKLHPATGYDDSGWHFEKSHSFRERLAGSGGLVTSVEDLSKFLAAQMEPGVFSREMLEQFHTRTRLSNEIKIGTTR